MHQELAADLMSLFNLLSHNLSIEKLLQSESLQTLTNLMNELDSLKGLLPDQSGLLSLKEKLICSYCCENPTKLPLKCGHSLCQNCIPLSYSEHPHIENIPRCPVCRHIVEFSKASAKIVQALMPSEISPIKLCHSCERILPLQCFYNLNLCHDLCKQCVWEFLYNGSRHCQICNERINVEEVNEEIQCLGCGKRLTVANSTFICEVHVYCFSCSKIALAENWCKLCEAEISDHNFQVARKLNYAECTYCSLIKEITLFVSKKCCKSKVCLSCQINFSVEKCKKCQKKVDFKENLEL